MDGKATVQVFLEVLRSKLTQYDVRASSKRGYNPYALAQYFAAKQRVEKAMAKDIASDSPDVLMKMKKVIEKEFIVDAFPPAKNVIKQIDAYLASGKIPRLRG